MWVQIKDKDGKIKHGIENIMTEQVKFYQKLLSSEGWDEKMANKLLENVTKRLDENQRTFCDSGISEKELSSAVRALKLDKSPGHDGITAEFYKKYWSLIKDEFCIVINEIEESETLCESQYRGVISLLYKQGDRDNIKNWRPITLLNLDYKIIAKVFAERLKKVLPSLIGSDQKAFIAGRQITETVRLIQDIIDKADENDEEGAIIFLDQEKAFDRVEWGYLGSCLERFGFGRKFQNMIAMLYKYGKSCINTNGYLTKYFPITRSMRQGCPVAAYLYILQAEPMAQTIRKSDKIQGIYLPSEHDQLEAKISLFADDTQLFHRSERSIKHAFDILSIYCKASGARLNMTKTKGLYIGSWKDKEPTMRDIKWVQNVTGLGAEFGYQINYETIWMQKFAKFKNTIRNWMKRDLSFKGKRLLIQSYIMSSMAYLTDLYPTCIPEEFLTQTKDLIKEFLWSGKTWRVAQKTCSLRKKHGGLEIPDLDCFTEAKNVMWIIKIHFSDLTNWNAIGKCLIKSFDMRYQTENFLLKCSSLKSLNIKKLPEFYQQCINAWTRMIVKTDIKEKPDILNSYLYGNTNITINKNPLFYSHWACSGIKVVNDLWDENTNSWKTGQQIFNQLIQKRNCMVEYETLKRAIPQQWKEKLRDQNVQNGQNAVTILTNIKTVDLRDDCIRVNNREVRSLRDLRFKEIYYHNFYPVNMPKCIETWARKLETEIDWRKVCQIMLESVQGRKQNDFHWKCIHRGVFTETRLKKMNRSNGICTL